MRQDAQRWDARYAGRVTGPPSPPKGLDRLELPEAGLCLDVACGLGEQAVWAALNGYAVIALDVSPAAIAAVREAAVLHGVDDLLDAHVSDLDHGLPDQLSDACDLVICQRYRDPKLYRSLVESTRPGGMIVVTVLSCVGLTGEGGEFHAPAGELVDAFRKLDVEIVRSIESDGEATLVARRR